MTSGGVYSASRVATALWVTTLHTFKPFNRRLAAWLVYNPDTSQHKRQCRIIQRKVDVRGTAPAIGNTMCTHPPIYVGFDASGCSLHLP